MPHKGLMLALALVTVVARAADCPCYSQNGELVPPADYREWIYLTSGIDMSYSEATNRMDHSMFDNVFVDPKAWASFKQSGHWPDKTMMVLEVRGAATKGSINKQGHYQTDEIMGLEVHLRDDGRFGGWRFFAVDDGAPGQPVALSADCYSCHQAHGAVDTTFTQFYPTAKPIAVKAGNFRAD